MQAQVHLPEGKAETIAIRVDIEIREADREQARRELGVFDSSPLIRGAVTFKVTPDEVDPELLPYLRLIKPNEAMRLTDQAYPIDTEAIWAAVESKARRWKAQHELVTKVDSAQTSAVKETVRNNSETVRQAETVRKAIPVFGGGDAGNHDAIAEALANAQQAKQDLKQVIDDALAAREAIYDSYAEDLAELGFRALRDGGYRLDETSEGVSLGRLTGRPGFNRLPATREEMGSPKKPSTTAMVTDSEGDTIRVDNLDRELGQIIQTLSSQERRARKDREIRDWIRVHGSEHLAAAYEDGYPVKRRYVEERVAKVLADVGASEVARHIDFDHEGDSDDQASPSESALDLAKRIEDALPSDTETQVRVVHTDAFWDPEEGDTEAIRIKDLFPDAPDVYLTT